MSAVAKGYIKTDRSVIDELLKEDRDLLVVFEWLKSKAWTNPGTRRLKDNTTQILPAGSLLFSSLKLSKTLRMGGEKLRRCLVKLKNKGFLQTLETDCLGTCITLAKFVQKSVRSTYDAAFKKGSSKCDQYRSFLKRDLRSTHSYVDVQPPASSTFWLKTPYELGRGIPDDARAYLERIKGVPSGV